MHRKNDLPPGSSVGLVLILWTALLCAALAWALFTLTLDEGVTDTLHIYKWEGM